MNERVNLGEKYSRRIAIALFGNTYGKLDPIEIWNNLFRMKNKIVVNLFFEKKIVSIII